MKKMLLVSSIVFGLIMSTTTQSSARPIYINIGIGLFAKWGISIGDCPFGWALCLKIGGLSEEAKMFYDSEENKLGILVSSKSSIYDQLDESLNFTNDGQVDPKIASNLGIEGKLYILHGKYSAEIVDGKKVVYFNYKIR